MDNVLQTFRKERHKIEENDEEVLNKGKKGQGTQAETDPAIPGAVSERSLIGLRAAGPTPPRDAVIPPVCVPTEKFIYNKLIGR